MVKNLLDENRSEDVIYHFSDAPDDAFQRLMKHFQLIEAAGGLVVNESGEVLMIYRMKYWDLPKGKIDKGETPAEAAKREVSEECGTPLPEILETLPETYHIYQQKGEWILKRTYWYLMRGSKTWTLVPQTEEDIEELCWVKSNELFEKSKHSYPAIADLLKFYKDSNA